MLMGMVACHRAGGSAAPCLPSFRRSLTTLLECLECSAGAIRQFRKRQVETSRVSVELGRNSGLSALKSVDKLKLSKFRRNIAAR